MFPNKYNALYNSVCYEYNEKDCIKQEDDEIFAHTHNIR